MWNNGFMNKKILAIGLVVIFLIIGGWVIWKEKKSDTELVTDENKVVTLYSNETSEIKAIFNNEEGRVTFTQADLGTVTLPHAVSASGARYANEDESIVFWEHQDEVTITKNGKEVFRGKVKGNEGESTLTTNGIIGTWVWEKTVMGDESEIIPNKAGVFSLQFDNEGMVYGKTDCNGFRGTYEVTDDKSLTFGLLASTLMYCEGSQENIFTGEVSQVGQYTFDDSGNLVLNMNLDSGNMYFERQ